MFKNYSGEYIYTGFRECLEILRMKRVYFFWYKVTYSSLDTKLKFYKNTYSYKQIKSAMSQYSRYGFPDTQLVFRSI